MLEGEVHVRLIEPGKEPREVPLRAGHLVCFAAGTRIAHCFVNRGERECRLLTVGERKRGVDKCVYVEDGEYNGASSDANTRNGTGRRSRTREPPHA